MLVARAIYHEDLAQSLEPAAKAKPNPDGN